MTQTPAPSTTSGRGPRQPRALRLVAWITIVTSLWGLVDMVITLTHEREVSPVWGLFALVSLIGGVGLLRLRRWGYVVTVASWASAVVWGLGFSLTAGEYTLAARLVMIPVIVLTATPLVLLLLPSARRWFREPRT